MTLLDCRISLTFEKLFIPILDLQEYVLDILYESKHHRFTYPQEVPFIMPLNKPFSTEKNQMNLTVMIKAGKKYRKIAKGEINFYKKYFMTENLSVEKWVYLALYETQLEQMGHNTSILKAVSNTGKVYLKAQLIDPEIESENFKTLPRAKNILDNLTIYTATTHASAMTQILKNNLKNLPFIKDKANSNKTEKFRSITEHNNEFLRTIKMGKKMVVEDLYEDIEEEEEAEPEPQIEIFNDGLSDVSISIIDGSEENHIEIDKMNLDIDSLVAKIKIIYENKIDQILPEDAEELKSFIANFTKQINNISGNYSQNLLTLADINKKIKSQAKDYFERYKETKKVFKKERRELKSKNKLLENDTKANVEENLNIQSKIEDLKDELKFFKHKVGIKEPILNRDDDLTVMIDILNSLKSSDSDITQGLEEDEKKNLIEILKKYEEEDSNKENLNGKFNEAAEDKNLPNGNDNHVNIQSTEENQVHVQDDEIIINKIQDIVNDFFSKKKITNMKIDQVDDFIFKFNEKSATFYLEADVLKVKEDGFANFEEWLLANFSLDKDKPKTPSATSRKANSTQMAQKSIYSPSANQAKSPVQNMIDKKLAEKKNTLSGSNSATTNGNYSANSKNKNFKK